MRQKFIIAPVSNDFHHKWRVVAAKEGVSMSALLRRLALEHIKRVEKEARSQSSAKTN